MSFSQKYAKATESQRSANLVYDAMTAHVQRLFSRSYALSLEPGIRDEAQEYNPASRNENGRYHADQAFQMLQMFVIARLLPNWRRKISLNWLMHYEPIAYVIAEDDKLQAA